MIVYYQNSWKLGKSNYLSHLFCLVQLDVDEDYWHHVTDFSYEIDE